MFTIEKGGVFKGESAISEDRDIEINSGKISSFV